ncbi:MAG: type II toxin-antitoxin system RelE/ParE family toxin [bacterium]
MKYEVKFPNHSIEKKFENVLLEIYPANLQEQIMQEVQKLAANPRPFGERPFKKLKPPIQLSRYVAQYRIRIGDFRVLYDVDDEKKIVWILALRRRSEKTYK